MWQKLERTWLKYDGMFTYLSYKEFSGKVLQGRCASPRVIRDPRSVLPVLHSATLRVRLSSEQFPAVPTAAHPTCIQGAEGGKGGRRVCFLFSDEVSGTFHRTLPFTQNCIYVPLTSTWRQGRLENQDFQLTASHLATN